MRKKDLAFSLFFLLCVLLSLYLRTSGLFRGLGEQGFVFHPDEPKQILALFNFLNGVYVRYYGSLFYDGYPYGLNHLDEYLLRPLLLFFQSGDPEYSSLYFLARFLRLVYALAVLAIIYHLVLRLLGNRTSALLALLLIGIAPLSITVSHFATGDIGVDLFAALCFLFLWLYVDRNGKYWLFFCGMATGAAFSAKYNGLLLGMVPATVLIGELLERRSLRSFVVQCCVLGAGVASGICIFTPNLLLDPKPTLVNIAANFQFIKNYHVSKELLALSGLDRALLGLKNNSLYIVSSLGYSAFLAYLAGLALAVAHYFSCRRKAYITECSRTTYILAIAFFPLLALIISLSVKLVVQPFHFSYLQIPILITCCFLLTSLCTSHNSLLKGSSLIIGACILLEFGWISWQENYFWRLEDNGYHSETLPKSIFDREAFYSHPSDTFRWLYVEEPSASVFRNHRLVAKGPDAEFWKAIAIAPLPQVANPIGSDWIFLNGPVFPRNERMLVVHGEGHGKTIQRKIVLPAGQTIEAIGIQSGSFATEAFITVGGQRMEAHLEAHQQKIIPVQAQAYQGDQANRLSAGKVHIIPLSITVPHNSLWITLLKTKKELHLYSLFGGEQSGEVAPPPPLTKEQKANYFDALSRLLYLDYALSWKVVPGDRIPMWEVTIPAGRYILTCEIDGLSEEAQMAIDFEDAKGSEQPGQQQPFLLRKGLQRIQYSFIKPFAPYQMRFVIHGQAGSFLLRSFKLTPDYRQLSDDVEEWRVQGTKPAWLSRFGEG